MQKRTSKSISTLPQRRSKKTLKFSLIRLFLLLLLFVAIYIIIGGEAGVISIRASQKEKKNLELEIKGLNRQYEQLEKEKGLLEGDLGYMEKIARERLGMIKENEILFRFVKEDSLP